MALPRNSITDFEVANEAYSLSEVTVFIANADGSKGALATLYSSLTGLGTLPNPQTLDNTGKWQQPVYIDNDVILQINSPLDPLLDHDTGIVRFGGRWRGVWTGPGTHYNIDDRILGPVGTAQESNVYKSLSIWDSSGTWATDLADATKLQLELDYQALRTLAMAAVPLASETVAGRIEIATQAEANAGASDELAITPLKLATMQATEAQKGVAEVATQTEVNTGANDTMIVTPAKLKAMAASETLTGIAALATQAETDGASNDTDIVTPMKLWTTPMRGGWRNIVGANGGFEVWQRGAGGSASIAVAAVSHNYTADRWSLLTNAFQASVVSQQAGLVDGSRFCARVQRNAGQTGPSRMQFNFALDADEAIALRGKQVRLTCLLRAGANWSPTSGTIGIKFTTGTGAINRNPEALTGFAEAFNTTLGLTPGGAAVTFTSALSSVIAPNVTAAGLEVFWTPVGTAGAADYFEIDDVMLEAAPIVARFERRPFEDELRACQRHYWKTFEYETAPAQNAGATGALNMTCVSAGAGAGNSMHVRFPVEMRSIPTVTAFNPSAANANWRNINDGADSGALSTLHLGSKGTMLRSAGVAGDGVNEVLAIHATFDSGI